MPVKDDNDDYSDSVTHQHRHIIFQRHSRPVGVVTCSLLMLIVTSGSAAASTLLCPCTYISASGPPAYPWRYPSQRESLMLIRTRPTGSSQFRIASRVIIMVIEGKAIKNRNDHQRLNTMLDCAPGKCRPSSSFSQKQKVKPLGKMTRVGGFPAGKVECTH